MKTATPLKEATALKKHKRARNNLIANTLSAALTQSTLDLLIGLELTQGVHGPNGRRNPPQDRDLQNQANDSSNRSPDGEEGEPGKDEGNQ